MSGDVKKIDNSAKTADKTTATTAPAPKQKASNCGMCKMMLMAILAATVLALCILIYNTYQSAHLKAKFDEIKTQLATGHEKLGNILEVKNRLTSEQSATVAKKAELFEYSRIVQALKSDLKRGIIDHENLKLINSVNNPRVKASVSKIMRMVNNKSILSDAELSLKINGLLRVYAKVAQLKVDDGKAESKPRKLISLTSAKNYLKRFLSVQRLDDEKVISSKEMKRQQNTRSHDWIKQLIDDEAYDSLLSILSASPLSGSFEDVLQILQLKADLNQELHTVQNIILE